jgi:hypothetical protein
MAPSNVLAARLELKLILFLRRTINHCPWAQENQSEFGQCFRLFAMEFTPRQEIPGNKTDRLR